MLEKFKDQNLPPMLRAADLVSQMTLEEKASQVGNEAAAIPRLGLRAYQYWNEASHGVVGPFFDFDEATSFPVGLAMSQTWNPETVRKVGDAISKEARALSNTRGYGGTYWCPTLNLARDPRWGRNDECYGEDPVLAGSLGSAYIRGLQGDDPNYLRAIATPKHFALNNSEYNRQTGTSNAEEATLREYYYRVFEEAIKEGKAFSIMTSYNRINGVPASASVELLQRMLREEWGFEGFVVSDCGAVKFVFVAPPMLPGLPEKGHYYAKSMEQASAYTLIAGTDMSCGREHEAALLPAVAQGLLPEEVVDRALIRIFTARIRLGEFDDKEKNPYASIDESVICCPAHAVIAEQAAEESLVLLKNENGLLPLTREKSGKVLVIGPNAIYRQLGGYSVGGGPNNTGPDTRVSVPPLAGIRSEAEKLGIEVGYTKGWHHTVQESFVLPGSEGLALEAEEKGMTVQEYVASLLPPEFKDIFNKKPKKSEPTHPVEDPEKDMEAGALWEKALKMAGEADTVIFVAGTDASLTGEEKDRETLALPYGQDEKIGEILAVNPNTVVVCISVGPVTGRFLESAPAILSAVYAGESQGTAIARVLFGKANPGGKTTITWYKDEMQLPHISQYGVRPMDTSTGLGRTYRHFLGDVSFPFGHGLSYTSFHFDGFALNGEAFAPGDTVEASVEVTNTGDMDGSEVLQLYVKKVAEHDNKPLQELKGYQKVFLKTGETKRVVVSVPVSKIAFWDNWNHKFTVEPGSYEVWLGTGSVEKDCVGKAAIRIAGKWEPALSQVTLTPEKNILKAGEQCGLRVTAVLEDTSRICLTENPPVFTLSDQTAVEISPEGILIAKQPGAAVIEAQVTVNGVTKRAQAPVVVR